MLSTVATRFIVRLKNPGLMGSSSISCRQIGISCSTPPVGPSWIIKSSRRDMGHWHMLKEARFFAFEKCKKGVGSVFESAIRALPLKSTSQVIGSPLLVVVL